MKILALLFLSALPAQEPRLLAGPDVLVSRENDFPHLEMMIAAHPSDPKKLLAGAMNLGGEYDTVVYSSTDGGSTWQPRHPAEPVDTDADPLVLYTPKGTALYLALPDEPMVDAAGKRSMPVILYRSEDGRSWPETVLVGTNDFYDHPQIAADPRSGRIYVSALGGEGYPLDLFRSDDDGRTFQGPKTMVKAPSEEVGINTTGLGLLADGTLVHTYVDFPMGRLQDTIREMKSWAMVSTDGGETFSEPLLVGRQPLLPKAMDREHFANLHSFPQMAAGGDRIHMAWTDFRSGRPQAVITTSADRGKTWSEPRPVAGPLPEGAYSFQPALAVNRDGVLGVSWLDTRNHPGTDRYDAWFSASLDGGATFLPAVRLSSESSDPLGAGNRRPAPGWFQNRRDKTHRVVFLSALTRYPQGGDYAGLAADAEGHFHPLWPDARTGAFQAWTARVKLERGVAGTVAAAQPTDLGDHVELTFDPGVYDAGTRELRLPIRI
ncbi:MAG: sialidase family protein, partial [Thermoanaerobaculia bacterium]